MRTEVVHQPEKNRYVIWANGREAGYAAYEYRSHTVRDFNHTVVDPAYRGQGLATTLILEALQDTRKAGHTVIPSCSAVERFISKNEAFKGLVENSVENS
ncbi:GNAT family N-acetyltransferase [Corynebacterium lubricantis]|uniref:GNAT family N-acetyltransferase n=1 Tax=Corynebacterium lubricantis TaxID=541095 RepID=UPI0003A3B811|nr:GNAT family N-acetyltransferase [Corynebacterium lubricantis]